MHPFSVQIVGLLTAAAVHAYPWAADMAAGLESPSVNHRLLASLEKRATGTCPTHATRQGAAPYSSYYPSMYTGAKNGQPGTGKGGVLVPAKGDVAHAYVAPGPSDIRGPCPALNLFANHNFISHDGLTTYDEMVDSAQNVFNWGWDLASFVASFGIIQDGDPLTETLSIGCLGGLSSANTGLDTHNRFEADSSLTRTDYALSPTGDAYDLNGTLFGEFVNMCGGQNFVDSCTGAYYAKRYQESINTNGDYFNGPLAEFVIGTGTLPINSFANFASGSPVASVNTISSFWGATKASDGSWHYSRNETFPQAWYNRPDSFTFADVLEAINEINQEYPTSFGGNTGAPNTFVGLTYPGFIENGTLTNATPTGIACLFYNLATFVLPTNLFQSVEVSSAGKAFANQKLASVFNPFACGH